MIVGESSKKYHLHRKLLCFHSTFFAAAFFGNFLEGITSELKLPEDDAKAFDVFVHWLYRGSLPQSPDMQENSGDPFRYLLVYSMAEKWFLPRLQDAVCDQIRMWTLLKCPSSAFFNNLYDITSSGCKLRQYFVKTFIFWAQKDPSIANTILEENGDLAVDVAKEMFLRLNISPGGNSEFPDPNSLPLCDFHVHRPYYHLCQPPWFVPSKWHKVSKALKGDK